MKKEKKIKSKKSEIKVRKISPEEFESQLEKEIEEGEETISDREFHEFLRRPSFGAETPVLKKNENMQEPTNLEQNLESVSAPAKEKENDAIKYKMISEDYESAAQRAREMQNEDLIIHQPLQRKRLEEQRIHLHDMPEQSFQFNPELQEIRRHSEGELEKDYVTSVKEGFKEKKTHSPFEQQEKEYKIR